MVMHNKYCKSLGPTWLFIEKVTGMLLMLVNFNTGLSSLALTKKDMDPNDCDGYNVKMPIQR